MVWIIIGVILASSMYAFSVVREYTAFQEEIQSSIERLEENVEESEKAMKAEGELGRQVRLRLQDARDQLSGLSQDIVLIEARLKEAQADENRLEMDMYRQEFRRSKKMA